MRVSALNDPQYWSKSTVYRFPDSSEVFNRKFVPGLLRGEARNRFGLDFQEADLEDSSATLFHLTPLVLKPKNEFNEDSRRASLLVTQATPDEIQITFVDGTVLGFGIPGKSLGKPFFDFSNWLIDLLKLKPLIAFDESGLSHNEMNANDDQSILLNTEKLLPLLHQHYVSVISSDNGYALFQALREFIEVLDENPQMQSLMRVLNHRWDTMNDVRRRYFAQLHLQGQAFERKFRQVCSELDQAIKNTTDLPEHGNQSVINSLSTHQKSNLFQIANLNQDQGELEIDLDYVTDIGTVGIGRLYFQLWANMQSIHLLVRQIKVKEEIILALLAQIERLKQMYVSARCELYKSWLSSGLYSLEQLRTVLAIVDGSFFADETVYDMNRMGALLQWQHLMVTYVPNKHKGKLDQAMWTMKVEQQDLEQDIVPLIKAQVKQLFESLCDVANDKQAAKRRSVVDATEDEARQIVQQIENISSKSQQSQKAQIRHMVNDFAKTTSEIAVKDFDFEAMLSQSGLTVSQLARKSLGEVLKILAPIIEKEDSLFQKEIKIIEAKYGKNWQDVPLEQAIQEIQRLRPDEPSHNAIIAFMKELTKAAVKTNTSAKNRVIDVVNNTEKLSDSNIDEVVAMTSVAYLKSPLPEIPKNGQLTKTEAMVIIRQIAVVFRQNKSIQERFAPRGFKVKTAEMILENLQPAFTSWTSKPDTLFGPSSLHKYLIKKYGSEPLTLRTVQAYLSTFKNLGLNEVDKINLYNLNQ